MEHAVKVNGMLAQVAALKVRSGCSRTVRKNLLTRGHRHSGLYECETCENTQRAKFRFVFCEEPEGGRLKGDHVWTGGPAQHQARDVENGDPPLNPL
eukprot:2476353-Pyramimonas_sp.AAC.1